MDTPITPVELRAGDLLLRPFDADDIDPVFAACQDPEIQRWTTVPTPYSRADATEFVRSCPQRWASGNPVFAVVDGGHGTLLAAVDLQDVAAEQGPMVGFWVSPGARRRGVATAAVRALAHWAFDSLGLPRIRWAAHQGNVGSRRVAERVGFAMEGTSRLALDQRGVRRDAWLGSLLPRDLSTEPPSPARVPGWPDSPVELRTERLLLRAFRDDDGASLLAYAQDPDVIAWDQEHTPDLEAAVARARARADWSSGQLAAWAIADPDDSVVLGGIVLSDVDAVALSAEAGYGLMPEARGNGYTAEALVRVTGWAFGETTLNRIALRHAVGNAASCAVARASGYSLEGTMRQSYRFGDGQLHDEHLHARLRADPCP